MCSKCEELQALNAQLVAAALRHEYTTTFDVLSGQARIRLNGGEEHDLRPNMTFYVKLKETR